MATKVLNLDKFGSDAHRTITVGGIDYAVEEMSVDNFIKTTKEAERLDKENAGTAEQINSTVEMIKRSIPTIPESELRKLSLVKMGVIVQFLRGDLDEEVQKAAEDSAAQGGEEVKK